MKLKIISILAVVILSNPLCADFDIEQISQELEEEVHKAPIKKESLEVTEEDHQNALKEAQSIQDSLNSTKKVYEKEEERKKQDLEAVNKELEKQRELLDTQQKTLKQLEKKKSFLRIKQTTKNKEEVKKLENKIQEAQQRYERLQAEQINLKSEYNALQLQHGESLKTIGEALEEAQTRAKTIRKNIQPLQLTELEKARQRVAEFERKYKPLTLDEQIQRINKWLKTEDEKVKKATEEYKKSKKPKELSPKG